MTVPLATICAHIRATLPDCTPASVAAHFALSRFHLSRRFHRETGLPLRDYIAALKIEHGIAALVAQKPVIDSQLDAGRAATGIAPARYRDKIAAYSAALSAELACPQPQALTVRLRGSEAWHVVFAGRFPAPIPRGMPVLGRALFHCREFRDDCAIEAARATQHGGKMLIDKATIGNNYGFDAVIEDSEGNRIGLYSAQ